MDRLNTLLTEEVNKIQKEIKELRKKAEEIQTEASSKKEPTEPEAGQVQMKELDSNFSRLSDIVENLQGRLTSQQENSSLELEQVQVSIRGLRKGLDTLSHESKQSTGLGMIDKQRRGWEEAREKAEQMSQIFDSLIITNDRPYVSCGLELPATCPGLIDFAQFELINKVGESIPYQKTIFCNDNPIPRWCGMHRTSCSACLNLECTCCKWEGA